LIEVARALVVEARVIVFDEPTSSLTRHDTEHLFALIARLKTRRVSIIYISHFLEEVQQLADRYTVLRDGQSAGGGPVAGTPPDAIIEKMVGRSLHDSIPACRTKSVLPSSKLGTWPEIRHRTAPASRCTGERFWASSDLWGRGAPRCYASFSD
jgi:ABC-type sugar transport system ATPase subunit